MANKVLIVDDEKLIIKGIRFSLEQDGYEVDEAYDGEEALQKIRENRYSIVLLDLMLPKLSGLEVCQQVRGFSNVPIIMLTAKGDDMDKIMGLDYGADDYITKPFNILEVKSRMKAILRRVVNQERAMEEASSNIVVSGEVKIDPENRRAFVGRKEISLTTKEFELLYFLATHPGKVYGRAKLLELVWGSEFPGDERTVDVHVRRLRERIEPNPSEPRYVKTKWGIGYYYDEQKA